MDGVKLKALKIARARGKYYVYRRETGEVLLRGFKKGGADEAPRRARHARSLQCLAEARQEDFLSREDARLLVEWFTNPDQCPEFKALSEVTQDEYKDRLGFLEAAYDDQLAEISTADIYEARDRASKEKWPAYADKMVTALSTMFTPATKRRWMTSNPAIRIDKVYTPDPNANREWRPEEWETVFARAPLHLRIAYVLARYAG